MLKAPTVPVDPDLKTKLDALVGEKHFGGEQGQK